MNFVQWDISNYYPAISPILLNKALLVAMGNAGLERSEIDVVLNARRTIMNFDNKHWVRKDRIAEFDITMGATDSAQVTDLVGLYLLHKLAQEFSLSVILSPTAVPNWSLLAVTGA